MSCFERLALLGPFLDFNLVQLRRFFEVFGFLIFSTERVAVLF